MPAALALDWGSVRALYVGGAEAEQLGKQFDIDPQTIRQRVHRGKWNEERESLKKLVSEQPRRKEDSVSRDVKIALVGTFQAWKESAINDVAQAGAEIARKLREEALKPDSTYDSQAVAFQKFEPASRVLKPFLGLNDAQQVNVGVQVAVLNEVPDMDAFELPK